MRKPEWNARFEENSRDGREVSIGKTFRWGEMDILVPAVYVCDEGLIVDLCIEVDRGIQRAFLEKWRPLFEREARGHMPTNDELCRFEWENPMDRLFGKEVTANGVKLRHLRGNGMQWIPEDLIPIMHDPIEIKPFMVHYGLSPERVWQFSRNLYLWEEAAPQELRSLQLHLSQTLRTCPGTVFPMPEVGGQVAIENPITGGSHILTVTDIQQESIRHGERENYRFPEKCTVMTYTLEPDLPRKDFFLRDTREDDRPIRTGRGSTIGAAVGVIVTNPALPKDRCAPSALHFEHVDTVIWQAAFRVKTLEDISVKLL